MKGLHALLTKRWIIRREDPDLYYDIKDNLSQFESFIKDKLGYRIIQNPLLIKLEKIPGETFRFMGITDFKEPRDYVFLCLLLMFLEDIEVEEQFILTSIIDYVKQHYPGETPIDWAYYPHRQSMIRVLRFCEENSVIKVTDGNQQAFAESGSAVQVLYENSGVSKYFMRRFAFEISSLKSYKDFENQEWYSDDIDRGIIRRQRIYRKLIMNPVVYWQQKDDQDYLYIKNQRNIIKHDFEKYLNAAVDIHYNGALLVLNETGNNTKQIPSRKNISEIALQFATLLSCAIKNNEIKRDNRDMATISTGVWRDYVSQLKDQFGAGWSKKYRELPLATLRRELTQIMTDYGMIKLNESVREIVLLPVIGKFNGHYPKDFNTSKTTKTASARLGENNELDN